MVQQAINQTLTPIYERQFVAKFDSILPQDAPKKAPKKVVSNDDANVALAVAVALRG